MKQPLRWERLKDVLIAIPAVHLFACFTYIYFYEASFGRSLENFASPRDVFAVSINAVAPTYISVFALLMFYYGNWDEKLTPLLLKKYPADEPGPKGAKREKWIIRFFIIVLPLLAGVVAWRTGEFPYALVSLSVLAIAMMFGVIVVLVFDLAKTWFAPITAIFVAFFLVGFNGTRDAEAARRTPYSQLAQENAKCGEAVILLPLSDWFLAVQKDESRVVIDADCKPVFGLYAASEFKPYSSKPLWSLLWEGQTPRPPQPKIGAGAIRR